MKFGTSILLSKSTSSNPGINWYLIFLKNSFKNKLLKFSTAAPEVCSEASVWENYKNSGLFCWDNDEDPLNPRTHPVKEFPLIPV